MALFLLSAFGVPQQAIGRAALLAPVPKVALFFLSALVPRTRRGRDLDVIEWRLVPGPGVDEGVAVEAGAARLRCLLAGARAETWTSTVTLGARPLGEVLLQAVAGFER